MKLHLDNTFGNPLLQRLSRPNPEIENIREKEIVKPGGFLDLLRKTHTKPESAAPSQDPSLSTMGAAEALMLCRKMQMQMNESLLQILSEGEDAHPGGNNLMEAFGKILSKREQEMQKVSIIRQVPSEKNLSTADRREQEQIARMAKESSKDRSQDHEIEGIIRKAADRYSVDFDLIKRVIQAESDFNPDAVSAKGAAGLMQLMPETAKELGVKDSFDPTENIMGGTRYLRKLLDRYDGSVPLALAAYNWGMGNLDSHRSRIPAETVNYVAKISGVTLV